MKHLKLFNRFLQDTVNLNRSRINSLQERVDTIEEFIRKSEYDSAIVRFNPQGSWAHKTIIKPPRDRDFDADLLMVVRVISNWQPRDYIENLHTIFKMSDRYKNLVSRKTRCVRINYANDFHIDLIPIIKVIRSSKCRHFNCNLRDNEFEETAPEAYTDWWKYKNKNIGGNQLRLVTRLLKYIRDIKGDFSCKSILLATLVGNQVHEYGNLHLTQNFPDIPTSFRTIVSRLDDWLQQRPSLPLIKNPVLPSEDYNRHWNQKKYDNFRGSIHRYHKWVDDAYSETNTNESILKWRRVFGSDFAKSIDIESVTLQNKSIKPIDANSIQFADEWLSRVRSRGQKELQNFPRNFDHIEPENWHVERCLQINIQATVSTEKGRKIKRTMRSGQIIPTGRQIKFQASTPLSVLNNFCVKWRVVNTGGYAFRNECLRGGFCESAPPAVRHESTLYRGVHWVEAFVINPRTNKLVGKSERFFVLIE